MKDMEGKIYKFAFSNMQTKVIKVINSNIEHKIIVSDEPRFFAAGEIMLNNLDVFESYFSLHPKYNTKLWKTMYGE